MEHPRDMKVLALVFALLLESTECFHYKDLQWHLHRNRQCFFSPFAHIHDASRGAASSLRTSGGSTLSSEEHMIRQEATNALLPVFFPTGSNDHIKDDNIIHIPITAAEQALKRLLREKQNTSSNNDSRGRLAALILGTSVMRLHHFYNVVVSQTYFRHPTNLPIPYPIDSSVISLMKPNKTQQYNQTVEEIILVRAMVDDHARYLSSNSNDTLLMSLSKSICDSLQLSIQYSLPHFLASSLLLQYGFKQTEEICALMNKPGPITLRRNAIQFPGSDMDLCKWLWEEDGIKVICCNQLHNSTSHNSKNLVITSTHDVSNRYVVRRSISITGSILPPNGALQIILPRDSINATTTIERRRKNKSIWSMKGWQNGYFEVQDAGSQIIAQSLEVKPGDSILDYCAGNGGKSFALASAICKSHSDASYSINDYCRSKIMCHDIVDERLRQIKGSLKRVGFTGRVDESSDSDAFYTAQNHDSNITIEIEIATSSKLDAVDKIINPHYFDAVLVDAPCSSTGVLRRRPSQRWDITETQVKDILPQLQLDILEKAATFVSPNGGKLVYSTCSLLQEENEDVARKFEQSQLGERFKRWDFETNNVSLADNDCIDEKTSLRHTLTILPSEDSDGFFIARWKRTTM